VVVRDGQPAAQVDGLDTLTAVTDELSERAQRSRGAIWLHTTFLGDGFGLYSREGLDIEVARWLGVIMPVGLLFGAVFFLTGRQFRR
jgi:hypothetical protein